MAKRENTNPQPTTTTPTPTPEVLITTPEPAPVPETTELVVASTTSLAKAEDTSMAAFIEVLPHMEDDLRAMHKVTKEELKSAIEGLDPTRKENFNKLLARMNPRRPGMHTGPAKFSPFVLKAYQGTGTDAMRPPKCPKGGVYSSTGDMVMVPKDYADDFEGVPQRIAVSVVGVTRGRTFFAKKDSAGNSKPPAGVELRGAEPVCSSLDMRRGTRYGECAACPYRPSFDNPDRSCKDQAEFYVVPDDFRAIWHFTASASSFATTLKIIEARQQGWDSMAQGQFWLETALVTRPGQEFVIWKLASRTEKNQPVMNSPGALVLLDLIVRQIETEVYVPSLVAFYGRNPATAAALGGGAADASAIAAAAGGADYSNNV